MDPSDVKTPFASSSICYKPYVCDGDTSARIEDLLAQAVAAEETGFDGVTVSEHHLGFPGYFPNPLQAASWILERTVRTWVAPAPMLPLLRPTNLVVEELAWLADALSEAGGSGLRVRFDPRRLRVRGYQPARSRDSFRGRVADVDSLAFRRCPGRLAFGPRPRSVALESRPRDLGGFVFDGLPARGSHRMWHSS